jgi:hypothetical protein
LRARLKPCRMNSTNFAKEPDVRFRRPSDNPIWGMNVEGLSSPLGGTGRGAGEKQEDARCELRGEALKVPVNWKVFRLVGSLKQDRANEAADR